MISPGEEFDFDRIEERVIHDEELEDVAGKTQAPWDEFSGLTERNGHSDEESIDEGDLPSRVTIRQAVSYLLCILNIDSVDLSLPPAKKKTASSKKNGQSVSYAVRIRAANIDKIPDGVTLAKLRDYFERIPETMNNPVLQRLLTQASEVRTILGQNIRSKLSIEGETIAQEMD